MTSEKRTQLRRFFTAYVINFGGAGTYRPLSGSHNSTRASHNCDLLLALEHVCDWAPDPSCAATTFFHSRLDFKQLVSLVSTVSQQVTVANGLQDRIARGGNGPSSNAAASFPPSATAFLARRDPTPLKVSAHCFREQAGQLRLVCPCDGYSLEHLDQQKERQGGCPPLSGYRRGE